MQRSLSKLGSTHYDVVVVGGGIFGVCVAWDAVLRGLSVALIEQKDFAHATSANHFKMVHGGIRYLQHGDVVRVRESSRERSILLRTAPHLVRPLPIVVPTYGNGKQSKALMYAALQAYDLLTFDRNHQIHDPARQIPAGRILSRSQTLEMFPHLHQEGLSGSAVFHDGQVYNPPRLALSYLKSAASLGADVANYVEVTGFLFDVEKSGQQNPDRVIGVKAVDGMTGETLEIRGKVVVNAAGPWAQRLLKRSLDAQIASRPLTMPTSLTFSRDAYFVVGRRLLGDHALAIQGETADPDAVLARGRRHLFLAPWREYTLVGVWHKVHGGAADDFTVTKAEINAFLDEINGALPGIGLTAADVSRWNAGLVLFGENKADAVDLSYGKRSLVIDHRQEDRIQGLLTVIGVRSTVARGIAARVVDLAGQQLGGHIAPSLSDRTPIYGGQIDNVESFAQDVVQAAPYNLQADGLTSLLHNYGSAYEDVLRHLQENPTWAAPLAGSSVLEAEVVEAVRAEMALTLGDVVFRRTELATGVYPDEGAILRCADLMAAELGWSEARKGQEIAEAKANYPHRAAPAVAVGAF